MRRVAACLSRPMLDQRIFYAAEKVLAGGLHGMGWDIKATADALGQSLRSIPGMPADFTIPEGATRWILVLLGVLFAFALLRPFLQRLWRAIEHVFFTNWQLAMLGSAALVLSLAGGWTTWDGMTNFTGEPVLSLMFTFGIHGVMLIIAWLIGESFATGMNTVARSGMARATYPLVAIILVGAVLLAAAAGIYQWNHGVSADRLVQSLTIGGVGLGALGLVLVFARSEVVAPYAQALRVIAKNAMLWVMFIVCMSTSVFFSFDSRFNVVFPQEERKRVADLRAQNQVTGILADIEGTITARRLEQAQTLFASPGWAEYDAQLEHLAIVAQGAQGEIERFFIDEMEQRRRAIAEQQERMTTAQSGQVGLANKKVSLTDELARLKSDRPGLAAEYAQMKSELDAKQREIDAKRVEAMAEDRGVEGTGKVGKGQVYRQRMSELARLQDEYKIKAERTKSAQKRLTTVESRLAQVERELSGIDGELAKLTGEAQTAEQRIKATEASTAGAEGETIDPARALLAFQNARADFRQEPTVDKLGEVQTLCTKLHGAMSGAPALKEKVRSIDCDPKKASDAASVLFALNAGFKSFGTNCAGGDKLAPLNNADALFGFARKCLGDSGLASKDTDALRNKISFTEMTRDDRAHRFVVSWNAFNDGNRLAYLALAIAIGIDSLIFMTGLFGANAVRSPLSDVPSSKARNAEQLEGVIQNSLLPDTLENASAVLDAMQPITPHDGYTAEILIPEEETPAKRRVLKVLNAGATIGAVRRDPERPQRYLIRSELFEFLSLVARKAYAENTGHARLNDLEKVVTVALLPNIADAADAVLHNLHPINEVKGFTSEIYLAEVEKAAPDYARVVRNVLNAGSTLHVVQRDTDEADRYYIHSDLYRTLAKIRARLLLSTAAPQPQLASFRTNARFGGSLIPQTPAIEDGTARLAEPTQASEVIRGFRASLMHAIGLDAGVTDARLGVPGVEQSALAAWKQLRAHGLRNRILGKFMRTYQEQINQSLSAEYSSLRSNISGDQEKLDLLDDADGQVQRILPILMLFPETGLISQLVADLERAAEFDGGQSEEEIDLLERLRVVRGELESLDLKDPQSWSLIGEHLGDRDGPSGDFDGSRRNGGKHLN